jgi:hypothetical protein
MSTLKRDSLREADLAVREAQSPREEVFVLLLSKHFLLVLCARIDSRHVQVEYMPKDDPDLRVLPKERILVSVPTLLDVRGTSLLGHGFVLGCNWLLWR